ncbi:ribosome hibernation-promoting factor, HPF/YfiA family [Oceanivirga miroungae]|uniref:Sigma 54 modulation protein/30S ribosomal protein S30EA n=1 Tax=Oceanivirga miroungae TaxID=1130046 RepID=A0A6I8MAB8_9FUSO|nr:ribosome-associated translation inhibitor RaiA [Oceanivirga miroungae]VWL85258.1 sigma 54 modulation protein/30S ribosomal protein S30EA [Oceanivirga miroungae]
MKIIISGKHIDLTEAIKSYINEKISKIEKYEEEISEVDVVIEVDKDVQKVTATAYLAGKTLRAEDENKDLYTAIDKLSDKLNTQVRKYKEIHSKH